MIRPKDMEGGIMSVIEGCHNPEERSRGSARTPEAQLLTEFRADYGKLPFANDPHRLGQ